MRCVLSHIRFLLLAGAFPAVGLSQTAQLTGTVSDSTGSMMPSAKVVATNIETGVARDSVTNEAGNYLITALLPGRYRITAEATGFKQIKREPVVLAVDQVGKIDFTMEVGETRDSVTVEASAVLLDSATSTIGNVVENRQVMNCRSTDATLSICSASLQAFASREASAARMAPGATSPRMAAWPMPTS